MRLSWEIPWIKSCEYLFFIMVLFSSPIKMAKLWYLQEWQNQVYNVCLHHLQVNGNAKSILREKQWWDREIKNHHWFPSVVDQHLAAMPHNHANITLTAISLIKYGTITTLFWTQYLISEKVFKAFEISEETSWFLWSQLILNYAVFH